MLNTLIVGASGYAGAELTAYLNRHPHEHNRFSGFSASADAGKLLSDLHPQLKGIVDLPLQLTDVAKAAQGIDVVFLATAHEVSHDIAPAFLAAGCVVFDLSGAFRVQDAGFIASTTVSHISMAPCWSRRYTAWRVAERQDQTGAADCRAGLLPDGGAAGAEAVDREAAAEPRPVAGDQRHQRRQRRRAQGQYEPGEYDRTPKPEIRFCAVQGGNLIAAVAVPG